MFRAAIQRMACLRRISKSPVLFAPHNNLYGPLDKTANLEQLRKIVTTFSALDSDTAPGDKLLDYDDPVGYLYELENFITMMGAVDVKMAYDLNTLYQQKKLEMSVQVERLSKAFDVPLFDKDQTYHRNRLIQPAMDVARILLEERANEIEKGVEYLSALEKGEGLFDEDKSLEKSKSSVRGGPDDYTLHVQKILSASQMFKEARGILNKSCGMSDEDFEHALCDVAVTLPDLGDRILEFWDAKRFALLMLHVKLVVARCKGCPSLLPEKQSRIASIHALLAHPTFILERTDENFVEYANWYNMVWKSGPLVKYEDALKWVEMLVHSRNKLKLSMDEFDKRLEGLKSDFPRTFQRLVSNVSRNYIQGKVPKVLLRCLSKSDQISKVKPKASDSESSEMENVFWAIPECISQEPSMFPPVKRRIEALSRVLPFGVSGPAKINVENLIAWRPSWVIKSEEHIDEVCVTIRALMAFFTKFEAMSLAQKLSMDTIMQRLDKSIEVVRILRRNYGMEDDDICGVFEAAGKWVRRTVTGSIPRDFNELVDVLTPEQIVKMLLMQDEEIYSIKDAIYSLYGKSVHGILNEVAAFPEMMFDHVAMRRAVRIAEIRNKDFLNPKTSKFLKWRGWELKLLVECLSILLDVYEVEEDTCITLFMAFDSVNCLSPDRPGMNPVDPKVFPRELANLVRAIIAEKENGVLQFTRYMRSFLKRSRGKISNDALVLCRRNLMDSLLKAPHVFVIKELWMDNFNLLHEEWEFVDISASETYDSAPLVFFYAIQERWRERFKKAQEEHGGGELFWA